MKERKCVANKVKKLIIATKNKNDVNMKYILHDLVWYTQVYINTLYNSKQKTVSFYKPILIEL